MKTYEQVMRPTTRLVSHTCDFCGAKIPQRNAGSFFEATLESKEGYSYPDNTNYLKIEVDICQGCFHDKMLPWLESQGVKINPVEEDF